MGRWSADDQDGLFTYMKLSKRINYIFKKLFKTSGGTFL